MCWLSSQLMLQHTPVCAKCHSVMKTTSYPKSREAILRSPNWTLYSSWLSFESLSVKIISKFSGMDQYWHRPTPLSSEKNTTQTWIANNNGPSTPCTHSIHHGGISYTAAIRSWPLLPLPLVIKDLFGRTDTQWPLSRQSRRCVFHSCVKAKAESHRGTCELSQCVVEFKVIRPFNILW